MTPSKPINKATNGLAIANYLRFANNIDCLFQNNMLHTTSIHFLFSAIAHLVVII